MVNTAADVLRLLFGGFALADEKGRYSEIIERSTGW